MLYICTNIVENYFMNYVKEAIKKATGIEIDGNETGLLITEPGGQSLKLGKVDSIQLIHEIADILDLNIQSQHIKRKSR